MCAAQRAGPGVKPLTKLVERVDPTAPVHKCRRNAIETQDNGGVLCRGVSAHMSFEAARLGCFSGNRVDRMRIGAIYLDHRAKLGARAGSLGGGERT